jgi:hypothetical protein
VIQTMVSKTMVCKMKTRKPKPWFGIKDKPKPS